MNRQTKHGVCVIYIDMSIYISYITYNRILVSHEKEWRADTWYNMTEPWKHYAKQNKQDTEAIHSMSPLIWNAQKR